MHVIDVFAEFYIRKKIVLSNIANIKRLRIKDSLQYTVCTFCMGVILTIVMNANCENLPHGKIRPKKINCMFPLTRPTLLYAADPKLFSAPKIYFTQIDKFWFALSHLKVTTNHKQEPQGALIAHLSTMSTSVKS